MRRFFIYFFLLAALNLNAQSFKVEMVNFSDGLTLCPLDDYNFEVKALLDDNEVGAKFTWNFGDDRFFSTDEPFFEYNYKNGGTYVITVKAEYQDFSAEQTSTVKVGIKPSFREFFADKNNICLGEKITLSMPVKDSVTEGFTAEYGAREMDRVIAQQLKPLLMREILFGSLKQGGEVTVGIMNYALSIMH